MSARQRNRLNQLKQSQKGYSDQSSDDDDHFIAKKPSGTNSFGFQMIGALGVSDSETGSDTDSESSHNSGSANKEVNPAAEDPDSGASANNSLPPPPPSIPQKANNDKQQKKRQHNLQQPSAEDEDLDSLLAEMNLGTAAVSGSGPATASNTRNLALLFPDPRHLNQENEIKRKFGSAAIAEEEEEKKSRGPRRRRGGGRVISSSGSQHLTRRRKKCLLGQGKPDWPPPISAVAGGIGMNVEPGPPSYFTASEKSAKGWNAGALWYSFHWSEAYSILQARFQNEVIVSADPQRLALFCGEHPYHMEALLQITMAMAHTGQMDQAADLLQRCLFYHECAYLETFRPTEGACRMDFCKEENRTFFSALFRHMQMSGMMGCPRTALEVGKFMLSLDPIGDPLGVLLCFDYYCIVSGEFETLLELANSHLPVGFNPEALKAGEVAEDTRQAMEPLSPKVGDLLNWAYSSALALFRSDRLEEAQIAITEALSKFPGLLPLLVDKIADGKHAWGGVLAHFRSQSFGVAGDLADHLAAIYLQRCAELWDWDPALDFLFECAITVAGLGGKINPPASAETANECKEPGTIDPEDSGLLRLQSLYSPVSPLYKYRQAMVTDFKDEFERLPGDANILNPALMAPRMARMHRQHLDAQMNAQFFENEQLHQALQASLTTDQGNLSPEMPLMQLFLLTLFPWNSVDTSGHHRNEQHPQQNQEEQKND